MRAKETRSGASCLGNVVYTLRSTAACQQDDNRLARKYHWPLLAVVDCFGKVFEISSNASRVCSCANLISKGEMALFELLLSTGASVLEAIP